MRVVLPDPLLQSAIACPLALDLADDQGRPLGRAWYVPGTISDSGPLYQLGDTFYQLLFSGAVRQVGNAQRKAA